MRQYVLSVLLILLPLWGGVGLTNPTSSVSIRLQGVDVSHHQRAIKWDTVVAKQPMHFAFVKATEGSTFTDTLFCHNWESLRRLGVKRGAYHFFRAYGCGDTQAQHFLASVEMYPGDLAPVLDVETIDGMPPEVLIQEMRVWLDLVEQRLGIAPIIYTNQHFYEKYLAGLFDRYPFWIARYSPERPTLTTGKIWDFWQYANDGCVDGIERRVDMNVFYGSSDMLERLSWHPKPEVEIPITTGP